jgi:uncharacterized membrane protein YphA (DoxX/SURF4 family)
MAFDPRINHVLTRVAIGLLLLWFGITGFVSPDALVGYVPGSVAAIIDPYLAVTLNAVLDTALGLLLLIGWKTRIFAAIAALHMAAIGVSVGYNDVMARDIALAIIAAAIAVHGPDPWTLDARSKA